MTITEAPAPAAARRRSLPSRETIGQKIRSSVFVGVVLGSGVVVAYLVANGLWFVVAALAVATPGFVLLHRAPLVTVIVWLLLTPLVSDIAGGVRVVFWLVHRTLPAATLLILVISSMLGIQRRPLARLGVPELVMGGYVIVTFVSILYTSEQFVATTYHLYDQIVIPMCLYLLVRLLEPGEKELRLVLPVLVFILVVQGVIGILSWVSPGVLPVQWLGRVGTRTTGSVQSPSVYGVTMIAIGALLLHTAAGMGTSWRRLGLRAMSLAAFGLAIFTLTRGVWLAVAVAVVALAVVHRHETRRLAALAVPLVILLLATGAMAGQVTNLRERFGTEETALARLPLAYAAVEMFQEKPITGWGYGNFDVYDREFQREVNGFVPEKDHSSHNLYLTQLAEQGLPGPVLFIGPAVLWLLASVVAYRKLPVTGFMGRQLLVVLWAVLLGHVMVNNFSNMDVVFGLGQWWIVLGLIASILSTRVDQPRVALSGSNRSVRSGA